MARIALAFEGPFAIAASQGSHRKQPQEAPLRILVPVNGTDVSHRAAEVAIVPVVGPEVLAGSTRLKAGTAQKLILNMLTTGAMTRLGYVYGNLMINVSMRNEKLNARAASVLERAASVDRATAEAALEKAGRSVAVALVMLKTSASKAEAVTKLKRAQGNVRKAIGQRN